MKKVFFYLGLGLSVVGVVLTIPGALINDIGGKIMEFTGVDNGS